MKVYNYKALLWCGTINIALQTVFVVLVVFMIYGKHNNIQGLQERRVER